MKRPLSWSMATLLAAVSSSSSSSSSSSVPSQQRHVPVVSAWSPITPLSTFLGRHKNTHSTMIIRLFGHDDDDEVFSTRNQQCNTNKDVNNDDDQVYDTRRGFLNAAAMNVCLLGSSWGAAGGLETAHAAAAEGGGTATTRYISGKPPQVVAGNKKSTNSGNGDVKGTRKDPDFLRSIADCRSQCQNTAGSDGLSKSKEDCLSECQDICCRTYEECTFNIVPRI